MKTLASILTSFLVAGWIGAIAVLAVQNFTPVSLRFLTAQSVEIPVGLVMAFSVGLGIVATTLIQPLLNFSGEEEED